MLTAVNKYPYFDLSEIIPDPDYIIKPYKPLSPVKTGNFVPDFILNPQWTNWQQFYNGSETHGPVLLRHLLDKPLVITFYSRHWKNLGIDHLKQLNAIQNEIKANGGNLLIITDEQSEELQSIAWEHSLSLNFYYDSENEIAKKFRVYSDENPAWNRFSGVDENVALLATYVIDPSRQVVFDHLNLNFNESFPAREIISYVYLTTLINNRKKSA
ncbi:redoxin domain-containing protein [Mucilaginibacter sp.]